MLLHRTNVNGQVKGRFQPHFDLLMTVGEGLVKEQFMEFFQMENKYSQPNHKNFEDIDIKSSEEQKSILLAAVNDFMKYFGYCNADTAEGLPQPLKGTLKYHLQKTGDENQWILVPYHEKPQDDEVFNYSIQLCHWYLHILELHDTAKESDLNRTILNCKYSIPFFYSHSRLSKYLVENVDSLLKTEKLLSPLQRIRVLEGSYVNIWGGHGNNVECDLVQEHSVCNQKALIKALGANKSEKSISRVTASTDAIDEVCTKFDRSVNLKPKSGRHSSSFSEADSEIVYKKLRDLRPFHHYPGRSCKGFNNVSPVPLPCEEMPKFKERLNQIIKRLSRGFQIMPAEEDVFDPDNEIIDNLPPL